MPETASGTPLRHLLDAATARLQSEFANPRREAMGLLGSLVGGPLAIMINRPDVVDDRLCTRLENAVSRRLAGEPLAYVVGSVGFRTCTLEIDQNVLIPRPETEGLVDCVFRSMRVAPVGKGRTVWDLGTGSGCVAIALSVEGEFAKIVATDVSVDALRVARRNAERNHAEGIDFRQGAFFEPIAAEETFDVIVSNPPYIASDEYQGLDRSVRDFEPKLALESGIDGLFHTRRILIRATNFLKDSGLLAIEIDSDRARQSEALARGHGWNDVRVEDDLFGRPRYLLAARGS